MVWGSDVAAASPNATRAAAASIVIAAKAGFDPRRAWMFMGSSLKASRILRVG
jgi:hypothetical protein